MSLQQNHSNYVWTRKRTQNALVPRWPVLAQFEHMVYYAIISPGLLSKKSPMEVEKPMKKVGEF